MTAYDRVVISGQSVLCGSRCVEWLAFVCPEVCMLPLQSVKVHTASDVTNEDEKPVGYRQDALPIYKHCDGPANREYKKVEQQDRSPYRLSSIHFGSCYYSILLWVRPMLPSFSLL